MFCLFYVCMSVCVCGCVCVKERERGCVCRLDWDWRASEVLELPHCFLCRQTLAWVTWVNFNNHSKGLFFWEHILPYVPHPLPLLLIPLHNTSGSGSSSCHWSLFYSPVFDSDKYMDYQPGGFFKYVTNVSFHACALICWVFKTNLKDGRKRRGQTNFFFSSALCTGVQSEIVRERWSKNKSEKREVRGRDNYFPFYLNSYWD